MCCQRFPPFSLFFKHFSFLFFFLWRTTVHTFWTRLRGRKDCFSGITEQKQKHCVLRQSATFLLIPPLYLEPHPHPTRGRSVRTPPGTIQQLVSVCVLAFDWTLALLLFIRAKRSLKTLERTSFAAVAATQTHKLCPQVFSAPSNPAVSHRVEPRWSQPVSVSVCIWVFFIIIISLQTASSLIILLTLIIRMVSVS